MLLSDLFDQLAVGELSQLSLSGIDSIGIQECNYIKIVPHIQLALTELYKRFSLKKEEVFIQQYEHIQTYYLHSKYAESNTESTEIYKYIKDSQFQPFLDNVISIYSVHSEVGEELYLNDESQVWNVQTPSYNSILMPSPEKENALSVIYIADHPKIPIIGLDPYSTEVNIPPGLLEPLLFYIASRVYTNLNSDGSTNEGNNFMIKFEASCRKIKELNLVPKNQTTNMKLVNNGWV